MCVRSCERLHQLIGSVPSQLISFENTLQGVTHSTVVGIVGAGGIGQVLAATFSRYDYDFSLAILITIVSLVFAGEFFSNWVRGHLR